MIIAVGFRAVGKSLQGVLEGLRRRDGTLRQSSRLVQIQSPSAGRKALQHPRHAWPPGAYQAGVWVMVWVWVRGSIRVWVAWEEEYYWNNQVLEEPSLHTVSSAVIGICLPPPSPPPDLSSTLQPTHTQFPPYPTPPHIFPPHDVAQHFLAPSLVPLPHTALLLRLNQIFQCLSLYEWLIFLSSLEFTIYLFFWWPL